MRYPSNKTEDTIYKGYRGILYPNKEQTVLIEKTFGCCRYVYNRFLDERKKEYEENGKTLSYTDQCKELPLMKKDPETQWLCEVDSTALQHSVRVLQDAYDLFFLGRKEGRHTGYPKFRSKHAHRQSYQTKNNNDSIRLEEKHLRLPKLGEVKCRFPMEVEGRIIHATVTRETDARYAVTLMCEVPKPGAAEKTGKAIGIDLGIHALGTTSDEETYENPKSYERNLKKLVLEQRQLSRKTKGSQNWKKQRRKVAKVHQKIRNQRLDASHKMTRDLTDRYDIICIEDLDIEEMKQKRETENALEASLEKERVRNVSDAGWREIRRQLEYKTAWAGKQLVVIDRWYPSSQKCGKCGYINPEVKDLRVRKWKCPVCGERHDRDINAARNILEEGLRQIS